MVNRKKRLQRGIDSLEGQAVLHEEKQQQTLEKGDERLAAYFGKEVDRYRRQKEEKKRQLEKA